MSNKKIEEGAVLVEGFVMFYGRKNVDSVLITPVIAKYLLANNNKKNRPISPASVDSIARDLKAGRWVDNGERMTFDTNGQIVSAQHRLAACAQTGVSLYTDIAFGLTEEGRLTADSGRGRKAGDNIHLLTNGKYGNKEAQLMNGVKKILDSHRDKLSPGLALAMINDFLGGIEIFTGEVKGRSVLGRAPAAAAFVLAGTAHPNKTRDLIRQIVGGEAETSAAKALVRYALSNYNKDTETVISSKVLFGIFAHMTGLEVERLQASPAHLKEAVVYFLDQIQSKMDLSTLKEVAPQFLLEA